MTSVDDRDQGAGGARRRVTRGYVFALIGAATLLAISLLVLAWGLLSLYTGRTPIETSVPMPVGPILVSVAVAALMWGMWSQALALLRGRRSPHGGLIAAESFGGYLIWCLGGMLAGMTFGETWLSTYAWLIVPVFALSSLAFWGVLARRVYTDRPVPQWPWEKRGDPGPDTSWRDDKGRDR